MDEQLTSLDDYVRIAFSENKQKAYLNIVNYYNGLSIKWPQLLDTLNKNNIVYGIQEEVLQQIATNPKLFLNAPAVIAVGDEPKDGENGYIEYVFAMGSDVRKPEQLDDGSVNLKEIISINNIRKGQLIAKRYPAMQGVPGKAVTGEAIPARYGKEARFRTGKNVVLDLEQKALYSSIDGQVTITQDNRVHVFPIFEVNGDVDYSIGNIDFVGTVIIHGNVLPGFKVKANGDVRVLGGVEAAELEAGGNIDISAGILGRNKSLISAGKDVKSAFIQDGNVTAGQDVIVSQSIMHSTIRAARNVVCNGNKGLIVGGTIQAGEKVMARTVGNLMSTITVIEVGVIPQLRNELTELKLQQRVLIDNQDKTDKALLLLDQLAASGQLGPDKAALRVKLMNTKRLTLEEISENRERILQIEKSLEKTENAKVEVLSTIFSGSKVVIGRFTKFIKDPVQRVSFILSDGEVIMSSFK